MTKVKMFAGSSFQGSLYFLFGHYELWLKENPNIKVISTLYDNGALVITYVES